MLAETLLEMNFVSTQADPDVYRQRSRKPIGKEYYELLLVYVDDVLACSHNPQAIMDALSLTYDLKPGSVGAPTIYLGAEIKKYQVANGKEHYSMSSTQYVKNGIKTVEQLLRNEDQVLRDTKTSGKQPLPRNYRPELEQSDELQSELMSRHL